MTLHGLGLLVNGCVGVVLIAITAGGVLLLAGVIARALRSMLE